MNLTIRRPDDMHCHFRWDDRLKTVLGFTARVFGRGLDMPNWKIPGHPWGTEKSPWAPGVRAQDVLEHRAMIQALCEEHGWDFEPIGCIYITEETDTAMIEEAARAGIKACKTFFRGVSTNSGWGVRDPLSVGHQRLLSAMQAHGLVNSMHVEKPGVFILDAEREALSVFERIVKTFPALRSVIEHISTADAVRMVMNLETPNVAATITPHHLLMTLDDVLSGGIRPHNYCMPVLKRPEDREALIQAAISGDRRFFFGSDTAPHERHTKESSCGCAGVFCAPVAMPVVAAVFEHYGALDRVNWFTSESGPEFYDLPLNEGTITLVKRPWRVRASYGDPEHPEKCIIPYLAGEELAWQVEGVDFS